MRLNFLISKMFILISTSHIYGRTKHQTKAPIIVPGTLKLLNKCSFPTVYILINHLVSFSKMSAQEEGTKHSTYFESAEWWMSYKHQNHCWLSPCPLSLQGQNQDQLPCQEVQGVNLPIWLPQTQSGMSVWKQIIRTDISDYLAWGRAEFKK